jgi:hypothetical protein
MRHLWIALLSMMASPALADPVRVTSGEHDGFTRLVFEYGRPVDWQLGRSLDGYELRLSEQPPPYDLTNTFDLIGTSRLAAIWADPDSGQVQIGLACACHAIPFEFRPGIIVIDLKDGPPPKGSSFETAIDDTSAAPIEPQLTARPRPRPDSPDEAAAEPAKTAAQYDWTAAAYANLRGTNTDEPTPNDTAQAQSLLPPDPGLQPLREEILHQIARGASQGVVDMALPKPPEQPAAARTPEDNHPSAQIRIGEAQTSVTQKEGTMVRDLGAKGNSCITAELLAVADWGDETASFVDQMASLRQGLSGEFDQPDREAIARAIQFQLFLGFGAEVRQLLSAFAAEPHANADVWRAISHLVDGEKDPQHLFQGQAACAGPAALWAVLGDPELVPGDPIDSGAVRLAFSGLPLHLRRLIGPQLVERLLALDQEETARALKDAITRAPGEVGQAVALMDAALDLRTGDASSAEQTATAVLADAGPNQPEALITLTEARIAQNLPMSPDIALALRAHLSDHRGTALEPRLHEALILAEAASGNFEAAFAGLADHPQRGSDVWAMAANLAPDETFLAFAVLERSASAPVVDQATAAMITRRLVGLGLPEPGAQWLSTLKDPDPLLVAETAIKRRDGRAALPALEGQDGEVITGLKLQALSLLGSDMPQAELLEQAGDLSAASAALARAGAWDQLAQNGQEPWKGLATKVAGTAVPSDQPSDQPYGPLARGHDLALAGAETRVAIETLLAALPPPPASTPAGPTPLP